ncbi:hypothetical protein ILYODFUR_025317 [Ilyodon furcidens]|uniref:Whirlin n=2 Tax=Goodeidae TaxID=28758 RepID=A0ABV0UM42_9TELE
MEEGDNSTLCSSSMCVMQPMFEATPTANLPQPQHPQHQYLAPLRAICSVSWAVQWAPSWWDVPGTPPGGGVHFCSAASCDPGFYKGVAGSQVTLSSLVNQSRAMLEEQARHLLTEAERQTMSYYVEEYRDGHIGIEQLVMALFELLNTHAKFSLLSEVRGLVAPQDLERFDGLVLRREIQALKSRQGTAGATNVQPDCLSMVSYPDTLTSSSASFMTNTTLSSARVGKLNA